MSEEKPETTTALKISEQLHGLVLMIEHLEAVKDELLDIVRDLSIIGEKYPHLLKRAKQAIAKYEENGK